MLLLATALSTVGMVSGNPAHAQVATRTQPVTFPTGQAPARPSR